MGSLGSVGMWDSPHSTNHLERKREPEQDQAIGKNPRIPGILILEAKFLVEQVLGFQAEDPVSFREAVTDRRIDDPELVPAPEG